MGLALSWVAVRGKTPEQVLTGLDASLTGRQGVFAENRFGARQLRRGWYALYAQECGHPWVHEESLALLSGGAEVLACQLDEHLMFSSAELWRAGERQWRVIHDAQLGADHLAAEGALPEVYGPIAAEQRQLRAGATAKIDLFFEVPLKLALKLTGLKHDEGDESGDARWEELSDGPALSAEKPPPWWKLW